MLKVHLFSRNHKSVCFIYTFSIDLFLLFAEGKCLSCFKIWKSRISLFQVHFSIVFFFAEVDSPMTRILNRLNIEPEEEADNDDDVMDTCESHDKENATVPPSNGQKGNNGKNGSKSRLQTSVWGFDTLYEVYDLCKVYMTYMKYIWRIWSMYDVYEVYMMYMKYIWRIWSIYDVYEVYMAYMKFIWRIWSLYDVYKVYNVPCLCRSPISVKNILLSFSFAL